jgi:hypothetical protein
MSFTSSHNNGRISLYQNGRYLGAMNYQDALTLMRSLKENVEYAREASLDIAVDGMVQGLTEGYDRI